ncbi:MAG: helix-turn-helix domain-containing protein [Clostridia bacterium]|nr:helix-turn-helix domain-containing protein [Clostridia bacterium]
MIEIDGMKMYDSEETAKLFNITIAALARWRKKGIIRSVYIGKKKYTSEQTIRDFLNGLIEPKALPKNVNK